AGERRSRGYERGLLAEVEEDATLAPGTRGGGAAAPDQGEAPERAGEKSQQGQGPGQAQGAQHDADQVEGGLLDLDPRDRFGEREQEQCQRRPSLDPTVDVRPRAVNWRVCVRLRAPR